MNPRVEFFSEDIDGVDYLNIGLKWEREGKEVRAVLGALKGELTSDQMKIISGIAEEACMWVLGLNKDDE